MMMKRLLISFCALLVACAPLWAAEIQFTAAVDQSTVGLGDPFTLQLTVSGEDMASVPRPELPALPDFDLLDQQQSSSSNVSIINGQIKKQSAVNFIYVLSAKKLGSLTIPACKLKYGGKEYQSQPLQITVLKVSQARAAPQQRSPGRMPQAAAVPVGDNLVLAVSADRRTVYVGEQVTLEYTLYNRLQLGNVNLAALPSFGGFWTEKIFDADKLNFGRATYDGREYSACLLKKIAVFPMGAGELKVDPMALNAAVVQGPRDIFDMFGTTQNVRVESKPVTITALPLPEPKPRDFSGGVGQFAISASLDRTSSSNNEPLNLTVRISGTGNLRLIERPVIPAVPGLEVLDPEVKEDIKAAGDVVRGTRTFRYPIMPQADGKYVIPALSLSYFDPSVKGYKTVSTQPFECTATGCSQNAPLVEATGLRVLGSDINYIKPDARALRIERPLPGWPLAAAYLLALALLGGASWYRGYLDRLSTDHGFARKQRSSALVRKRLKQAEALLKKRDDKGFYAALSQAVLGYAGDRYNIETQAMTKEQLRDELARIGIDGAAVARVIGIVEQCEIARFSPGLLADKDPRRLFEQAKTILSEL